MTNVKVENKKWLKSRHKINVGTEIIKLLEVPLHITRMGQIMGLNGVNFHVQGLVTDGSIFINLKTNRAV